MKLIKIKYKKNIENAIAELSTGGYTLDSIMRTHEVELRFYFSHPATEDNICIVRQFWDEMYPETKDDTQPDEESMHIELCAKTENEFAEMYLHFTSTGLMEPKPDNNLSDVAVIMLKDDTTRIVCPGGYTWE